MWALSALTSSRRVLVLFALMVLLPGTVFGILIVRSVQSDRVRALEDQSRRQREIVRLFELELSRWLVSTAPDGAITRAAFRFKVDGDRIVFPEFDLALPIGPPAPRPRTDALPPDRVTAAVVTDYYYPRILVLLRDFKSRAQYFQRLRSLVVLLPGSTDGYAITASQLVTRADEWLAELCAGAPFIGSLRIGDFEDRSPTADPFALAGFPFFRVVFDHRRAAGTSAFGDHTFAYSMSFLVMLTSLGSFLVYRAVSQDVRLSELRSDFVSAVSHEFRSPLSSMLVLLERLDAARIRDPEKLAEYHAVLRRDAERLAALITRLLDFAQIESGKQRYALERVDLAAIAREAVEASRRLMTNDRLRCVGDGAGPLWVSADRTALQDCIQNLIENAAKYSAADQPIDVTCSSANGHHLVEVRDRGIGVPRSEHSKIFEKFYRGARATELNVQGVGIGLSLVKHVVEYHGGSVSVESETGTGSCFRLHLPAATE